MENEWHSLYLLSGYTIIITEDTGGEWEGFMEEVTGELDFSWSLRTRMLLLIPHRATHGCQSPTVSRVAATALLGVICMRWGVRGDYWLSSC